MRRLDIQRVACLMTLLLSISVLSACGGQPAAKPSSPPASSPPAAPKPAEPADPKKEITSIVAKVLQGDNNLKKPFLRGVEFTERVDKKWTVAIEMNAADNLSPANVRLGIEMRMKELYQNIYTSRGDVGAVTVAVYFPLKDKYGNVTDECIYKTALDQSEAVKIKWENISAKAMRNLWKTSILHPELRVE